MIHAEKVKLAQILLEGLENTPNSEGLQSVVTKIKRTFPEILPEFDNQRKRQVYHEMAEAMIKQLSDWTNDSIRDTVRSHGNYANVFAEYFHKLDEKFSPLESILESIKAGHVDNILNDPKFKQIVDSKFLHEKANAFLKGNLTSFDQQYKKDFSHRLFVVARKSDPQVLDLKTGKAICFSIPVPANPYLFRISAMKTLGRQVGDVSKFDIITLKPGIPDSLKGNPFLNEISDGIFTELDMGELRYTDTDDMKLNRDVHERSLFCVCLVDEVPLIVPIKVTSQDSEKAIIEKVAAVLNEPESNIDLVDTIKSAEEVAGLLHSNQADLTDVIELNELPRPYQSVRPDLIYHNNLNIVP